MTRILKYSLNVVTHTLIVGSLLGQQTTFDSTSDGSDGALIIPGAVANSEDFQVVYDEARDELVLFGGQSRSPRDELDHTYTFDGSGWTRKRPETSPPATDEGFAMAYDSFNELVVLYVGNLFTIYSAWTWNGSDWTEINKPDPERAFQRVAMAYDKARGQIVLAAQDYSSDQLTTFTFDGTTWTEEQTATVPTLNNRISLVYDETLQLTVLITNANTPEATTWTWNGTDWTSVQTSTGDFDFTQGKFVYNDTLQGVLFLGNNDNSEPDPRRFDGTAWNSINDVPTLFTDFSDQGYIYHPTLQSLLRINGGFDVEGGGRTFRNETWAWNVDGTVELIISGSASIDMASKPEGIWNFTSIDIGPNVEVAFENNSQNRPIRWLASEDVLIEGHLNLDGVEREVPELENPNSLGGFSGPGGFPGATAGPPESGLRVIGDGPGGGIYKGTSRSSNASIEDYSNPWIYPLIGGSGAGNVDNFRGGGGGGGALMIASSKTITHNGRITALGGTQRNSSSGVGSGGSVLLRATSIAGVGSIEAGRIRHESYDFTEDAINNQAEESFLITKAVPLLPLDLDTTTRKLWVDSINATLVADPPLSSESQDATDAAFSGSGPVDIVVRGENIPDQALISLRISLQDETVLEPDPAVMTGGLATFNIDLPLGFGAISATASFPFNNP